MKEIQKIPDAISERSPEAKRAFIDGYEQGMVWALDGIRRGLSPAIIARAAEDLVRTMKDTLND